MCVLKKKKTQIRIYGAKTKLKKQVQKLPVQHPFHVLLLVCLPISAKITLSLFYFIACFCDSKSSVIYLFF